MSYLGLVCRFSLVSILVVVDRSRQQGIDLLAMFREEVFQSLLWWIGRVNDGPPGAPTQRHGVSILVVVDRSRQPA